MIRGPGNELFTISRKAKWEVISTKPDVCREGLCAADWELSGDQIDVWLAALDRHEFGIRQCVETLSCDERIRADQFYFERDRGHFIARRYILRALLGRYVDADPSDLRFRYGKNGKPELVYVPGNESIHFNLSHSGGFALFAFAWNCQIGVDIERLRDVSEMEQIVERYFSSGEKRLFGLLPQTEKREAFFKCWTRKEALLKAMGEGLSRPLDEVEVGLFHHEPDMPEAAGRESNDLSGWLICDLVPVAGYVGAFAAKRGGFTLRCFQW